MTYQKAIDYFKRRKIQYGLADNIQQAENCAIEALEKQIPKKPVKTRSEIVCPTCDTLVGSSPYCRYCGQALDWSE